MDGLAYALAGLLLLAPAAAAADAVAAGPAPDGGSCDFFSYTLEPPAYRIDPDCPPIEPGRP